MKKIIFCVLLCLCLGGCGGSYVGVTGDMDIWELSNRKMEWGLKKNLGARPDINPGETELLSEYSGYYTGDETKKEVYLTFDEGYENGYTSQILDVLKKHNVPAAFFVTGPYLKKETELIKRMVEEGHIVGNHTVNHPSMPAVKDRDELEEEILGLERDFYGMTGKTMKYLRPPMGEHSERTMAMTEELGYKTIFWSIAYMDWDVKNPKGVKYVTDSVLNNLHSGAIILMHAVSEDNAKGLEGIITEIKNRGFEFKALDELPVGQESMPTSTRTVR